MQHAALNCGRQRTQRTVNWAWTGFSAAQRQDNELFLIKGVCACVGVCVRARVRAMNIQRRLSGVISPRSSWLVATHAGCSASALSPSCDCCKYQRSCSSSIQNVGAVGGGGGSAALHRPKFLRQCQHHTLSSFFIWFGRLKL